MKPNLLGLSREKMKALFSELEGEALSHPAGYAVDPSAWGA